MRKPLALIAAVLSLNAAADDGITYAGESNCRVVDPHPVPEQSATWNGACKDGYAEGPGALQWYLKKQPTARFEGTMVRGQPEGDGAYRYANQSQYEGQFKNGLRDGAGTFVYADGSQLKATYQHDTVVGSVTRRYLNGDRYEGGWSRHGPHGAGKMTYALGGSYEGSWTQGQRDGHGVIVYPNGIRLEVEFAQGRRVGTPDAMANAADAAADTPPAPAEKKSYTLKEDDARVGTMMRREFVHNARVPLDKAYRDLTPEQQHIVKEPYAILQENDEPPYPLRGLQTILKEFNDGQRTLDIMGTLQLDVQVDASGKVSGVVVRKSPDPALTKFAAGLLVLSEFKPAVCAGQPCAMAYPFHYTFEHALR